MKSNPDDLVIQAIGGDAGNNHGDAGSASSRRQALGKQDVVHYLDYAASHVAVNGVVEGEGLEKGGRNPVQGLVKRSVFVLVIEVHGDLDDGVNITVLVFVDWGELRLAVVSLVDLSEARGSVLFE